MRLIDADALIEILAVMQGRCNTKAELIHNSKIWQQVKDMPTVDAVPVIRCKDCVWNREKEWVDCYMSGMHGRNINNFCSRGERKEHETD